ncbi:MAG TPA: hypothetical protein VHI13_14630 [Candidatus Kapabacteria bacterium]|nr:hypothetical protein [Candidatus Kapabacteria bacterium]
MRSFAKNVALAVSLCALAAGTAFAQGSDAHPRMGEELRAEIVRWATTTVVPQVRQWKTKLDGAMSPADLQTLNGLRERARVLRSELVATGKAMRTAWHDEDYAALKTSRDKMKELAGRQKELGEALKPLAERYKTTLMEIGTAAKPKMEEWKKQSHEIVSKWMDAHKDQMGTMAKPSGPNDGGMPPGGMPRGGPHHGGCDMAQGAPFMMGGDMHRKMMVARFMLWDGGGVEGLDEEGQGAAMPEMH